MRDAYIYTRTLVIIFGAWKFVFLLVQTSIGYTYILVLWLYTHNFLSGISSILVG